jgi:hypothetical protein
MTIYIKKGPKQGIAKDSNRTSCFINYSFNEWVGSTVVTYWRKPPDNVRNVKCIQRRTREYQDSLSRGSRVFHSVESVSYNTDKTFFI